MSRISSSVFIVMVECIFIDRGALIKRKLRKVDPYRPREFARKAQEQFVRANEAIQK